MAERVIGKVRITAEAEFDYEDITGRTMPKTEIKREIEEYIENCINRFNGYYFKAKYRGEDSEKCFCCSFIRASDSAICRCGS